MTPERREELLRRQRWTLAELRELTGWSRYQLYRLRKRIGLRGKWTYAHQLRLLEPDLWTWMREAA